jgi:hypothetical protein
MRRGRRAQVARDSARHRGFEPLTFGSGALRTVEQNPPFIPSSTNLLPTQSRRGHRSLLGSSSGRSSATILGGSSSPRSSPRRRDRSRCPTAPQSLRPTSSRGSRASWPRGSCSWQESQAAWGRCGDECPRARALLVAEPLLGADATLRAADILACASRERPPRREPLGRSLDRRSRTESAPSVASDRDTQLATKAKPRDGEDVAEGLVELDAELNAEPRTLQFVPVQRRRDLELRLTPYDEATAHVAVKRANTRLRTSAQSSSVEGSTDSRFSSSASHASSQPGSAGPPTLAMISAANPSRSSSGRAMASSKILRAVRVTSITLARAIKTSRERPRPSARHRGFEPLTFGSGERRIWRNKSAA